MPDKKTEEKTPVQSTEAPKPQAPAEEKKPDKTIPGGKYLVNGVYVDCNGEPIKE
jgi:hypothetical protein